MHTFKRQLSLKVSAVVQFRVHSSARALHQACAGPRDRREEGSQPPASGSSERVADGRSRRGERLASSEVTVWHCDWYKAGVLTWGKDGATNPRGVRGDRGVGRGVATRDLRSSANFPRAEDAFLAILGGHKTPSRTLKRSKIWNCGISELKEVLAASSRWIANFF